MAYACFAVRSLTRFLNNFRNGRKNYVRRNVEPVPAPVDSGKDIGKRKGIDPVLIEGYGGSNRVRGRVTTRRLSEMNFGNRTIVDRLQYHAQTRPDAVAFRFLANGERQTDVLTFAQ